MKNTKTNIIIHWALIIVCILVSGLAVANTVEHRAIVPAYTVLASHVINNEHTQ